MRATLMDALYGLVTNEKYDQSTKLKLSYNILNSASKFSFMKPCIKKYLKSHVKSRFVEIASSEWDIALFLPIASWRKANPQKVYYDSRKAVKK